MALNRGWNIHKGLTRHFDFSRFLLYFRRIPSKSTSSICSALPFQSSKY